MPLAIHSKGNKGKDAKKNESPKGTPATPSWLKRGAAAKELATRDEARREQRKEAADRMHRFRLDDGEGASITFLDGDLVTEGPDKGMLAIPLFEEHEIWGFYKVGPAYFLCVRENEECPLCRAGVDNYFAGAMTIIDHRGFKKRDGTAVEYSRKLFVAKGLTLKKLTAAATKRGGSLVGWTVDVSRSDKRSARVGDDFDWQQQHSMDELLQHCPVAKPNEATDFGKELPYRTAAELVAMGLGDKVETGSSAGGFASYAKPGAKGAGSSDDIPF